MCSAHISWCVENGNWNGEGVDGALVSVPELSEGRQPAEESKSCISRQYSSTSIGGNVKRIRFDARWKRKLNILSNAHSAVRCERQGQRAKTWRVLDFRAVHSATADYQTLHVIGAQLSDCARD